MSAALSFLPLLLTQAASPIRPRIDLRTGMVAAGAIDAPANLGALAREVRDARLAWRNAGFSAPLSVALSDDMVAGLNPEWVSDAAREAGCTTLSLTFELDEKAVIKNGSAFAENLRARGWGVALVGDPACPLPFGEQARTLYTELILDAPNPLDPYLGVDASDHSPLGRRMFAAKEAGLVITAQDVKSDAHAALLALAGFDRAGGKVAAQPSSPAPPGARPPRRASPADSPDLPSECSGTA